MFGEFLKLFDCFSSFMVTFVVGYDAHQHRGWSAEGLCHAMLAYPAWAWAASAVLFVHEAVHKKGGLPQFYSAYEGPKKYRSGLRWLFETTNFTGPNAEGMRTAQSQPQAAVDGLRCNVAPPHVMRAGIPSQFPEPSFFPPPPPEKRRV